MKLTAQQVQDFHDHGVLIAPDVLTEADLAPVIHEIERFVDDRARQHHLAGKIQDLCTQQPFECRLAGLYAQCPEIGMNLDIMQLRGRATFEFLFNANLLDALEDLLGTGEITCNPIQHLRAKLPSRVEGPRDSYLDVVPWHQDLAVTWEEADQTDIITCWIPLVNANQENGCMRIVPDVYRKGLLEHGKVPGSTQIQAEQLSECPSLIAECPKGGVVFMHRLTPHMGLPNCSDTIRWTMDLRYQPTGQPTGRPFWPDFPVRSRSQPQSVIQDHAQWCARWEDALAKSSGYAWHRTAPKEKRAPVKA